MLPKSLLCTEPDWDPVPVKQRRMLGKCSLIIMQNWC